MDPVKKKILLQGIDKVKYAMMKNPKQLFVIKGVPYLYKDSVMPSAHEWNLQFAKIEKLEGYEKDSVKATFIGNGQEIINFLKGVNPTYDKIDLYDFDKIKKKGFDETLGQLPFNPHDRYKTKLVQNSRTGNFMDTDRTDIKVNKMTRDNRVFEDTQLKPDKTAERPEDAEVSQLDAEMFENIKRDLMRLNSVVSKTLEDVRDNKGQHYDEYILKLKRIFEPLVVTMQKLPDHKDELGKEEPDNQEKSLETPQEQPESPEDFAKKNNINSLGGTELDKELQKQKNSPGQPDQDEEDANKDMKKNRLAENTTSMPPSMPDSNNPVNKVLGSLEDILMNLSYGNKEQAKKELQNLISMFKTKKQKSGLQTEYKAQTYVDKVALKTRTGRIVWVKRAQAPKYIAKKGYSVASGAVPRSKKKKSSKPHKTLKKAKFDEQGTGGLYTGAGTHLNMPQDKQEMIEDKGKDSTRYIMRGLDNKTYAIKKEKCQRYLDKGFTLEKDPVERMPKTLKVNESKLSRIVKEELSRVVEEITKKELKALKK